MRIRVFKILKNTSGASFLFVLGLMTFLMSIGISSLVAASANMGFMLQQRQHNQLMILNDSVHRSVFEMLKSQQMSEALAFYVYHHHTSGTAIDAIPPIPVELTLTAPGITDLPEVHIDLKLLNRSVREELALLDVEDDRVLIDFRIAAEVTLDHGRAKLTLRTVYNLTHGELDLDLSADPPVVTFDPGKWALPGRWMWEMVSYDKVR